MTYLGGCLRFQPTVIGVFRVEDMQTTQDCYFYIFFILCFLTIHFKCSHISLVLVSWDSEYSCFTWNGVLAWPGRHENPADGGPPSWDGRCIEDLARWNQGQLMGDETNAIPKYTKMTVLWSRSCWTVASVAVLGVYAFCVIGSCGDDTDVFRCKVYGTFAYVKQRAPVAVSDRAILYIYVICIYVCEIDQNCCFFRQVNLRRMAKPLDASYYLLYSMYSSMCGVLQLDTLVPLQGKQANQWFKPVLWSMGTTGLLTPGVAVAKETKKDIVDRQEARDKASAMSSHRRILAWEKDLRTKNARQLVILAYFLVHITQQNKCVPSLQLWSIPMLLAADWMWLTPRCIEMGCRTAQIGILGQERKDHLEALKHDQVGSRRSHQLGGNCDGEKPNKVGISWNVMEYIYIYTYVGISVRIHVILLFPWEDIYLVNLHPIRRCIKKGFEEGWSERLRVGIPRLFLGLSESECFLQI